jgi:ribonuclease D
MPSSLSPKQRRVVHEICTELDLFHCTLDLANKSGRTVFVSPYADGFDALLRLKRTDDERRGRGEQRIVPVYRYAPWFSASQRRQKCELQLQKNASCTNDDDCGDNDRTYLVERLIDQPGDCLRPGIDSLDFGALESATLESLVKASSSSSKSSSNWVLVDTPAALEACLQELESATEIGFDLEAYNRSKSAQLTCLVQIRAGDTGKEYVVDPLAPGMWHKMRLLRSVFENPRVVKVGHSIGTLDVRCLHRDFGIWVVNAFDTYEAARVLGLEKAATASNSVSRRNGSRNSSGGLGLTALCRHYGCLRVSQHEKLKAEYQRCDWRARPLTAPMLEYSRLDVRYLIALRTLLLRDLTRSELFDRRLDELRRESRLVAEALEAVARMEVAYQRASDMNQPEAQLIAEATGEGGGGAVAGDGSLLDASPRTIDVDDDTFKTSYQREGLSARQSLRSAGDAGYFTAASSLSLESGDDDDEGGDSDASGLLDLVVGRHRHKGGVVLSPAVVAPAETLRMQPSLMQVLTRSQERCLLLWSAPKQQDDVFFFERSLLDLWFFQQKIRSDWDDSNLRLYLELVEWRAGVANELGCSEEFVAELDFLVQVAWRKPASLWALRRISWDLPDVLLDFEQYREQLLSIVKKYRVRRGGDGVRFYGAEVTWYRRKKALLTTTVLTCAAMMAVATASRLLKRWR